MSQDEYRRALDAAVREFERAIADRATLDSRIAQLQQTIGTLTRLCGFTPTVPLPSEMTPFTTFSGFEFPVAAASVSVIGPATPADTPFWIVRSGDGMVVTGVLLAHVWFTMSRIGTACAAVADPINSAAVGEFANSAGK